MVSSKNFKYKVQQDAKRVPHYGIRKLSAGVASVLLGTVVYMQNGSTVHADVNPTVRVGNDSVKVTDENVGVGYSAGAANGTNSADSAGSVVAAGGATDSPVSSQASESPAENATGQDNDAAVVVGESESVASAGQAKPGVNQVVASDDIKAVAGSVAVPNRPASVAVENPSKGRPFANLSVKPSFLAVSKVASTGTSNNAVNGGFDEATWGKLDVNAWQGHVQGDYYQLTAYTGDANHVIVPNEADFEKAGISTAGKQVGVTSFLMHRIFRDKTTAQDATVAFSKTDNKQAKAINADWKNTWGHDYDYVNGLFLSSKGKLTKFDGSNLDVSNVTNMTQMFEQNQISNLSSLASWKVDNVKNMSDMFKQNQIKDLSPLANWKVNNMTDMSSMFYSNQISDLSPLANWKVNNVTDMSSMFYSNQISDLSSLANWKVDNVTDMSLMFDSNQISDLSSLANWKVDNVTNMGNMFSNNQIDNLSPLANWKVDNVTNMNYMFGGNKISDLSSLANWKVNNVTNMNYMFRWNNITDLSPLANWKVDNVTNMSEMFAGNQISDLSPLANWKVDNVTNMGNMFSNNQISDLSPLASWKTDNVTNMSSMFDNNQISDLSSLANWNVSNVTDMNNMFYNNQISDLSSLANWKVDNVTGMNSMFAENQISNLSPLANWKVDNVTNMSDMFRLNKITDLSPLANWNVSNVTDMSDLFYYNQIRDLSPLANWKVDKVTNMSEMFRGNQIRDLSPLANWKVDQVTNMSYMFDYNLSTQTKNLQAKRVINFAYPDGYTGKKQDPVTQTVDVPQRVNVELITKDSKPSNNILDWVTKTQTPETPAPVYFQDYPVPAIKGLLEPDKTVIAGQQADLTKPINVTVTYKLLESNTNDAFAVDSKNGLHEHANVNNNGGYDEDYWGKLNVDDWNYTVNGDTITINGLKDGISTGANDAVIVPNLDDFKLAGKDGGAKTVYISKTALRETAKHKYYGLSKTNGNTFATDSDLNSAFFYASNLTHVDLNSLNTGNVTNMNWMFGNASSLTNLDVSNWDTSKVTNMSYMFNGVSSLASLDVSNWDTSKVTNMGAMFDNTSGLTNLDVSKWDTGNVTNMNWMFGNASSLTNLDVSNWDTSKVTDMSYMFNGVSSLASLDVSNWKTNNVTNMNWMFGNASSLTNLDVSKWDTSKVTNMYGMFNGVSSLTNLDVLNWNTGKVTDMSYMFNGASSLTNLDVSKWKTGNVTDMGYMFDNVRSLTDLDVSNWDTSKVTNMSYMFNDASSLTNLDVSKWDTGNVTNMNWMFCNASSLASLDMSNWDTSKVTNMRSMFNSASSLTDLDLSKWNTSKVTNMLAMFRSVNALRYLNISNWDLTKLANKDSMKHMFAIDINLTIIANDLVLPTWYQNEINDANYFWNNHMAVITNVPELIKSTGDINDLKIDNQDASRSIFYDSKGSSDAIQVLKDANRAYIKQYQNEHPGYILNLAADVDQTDPIALANANFISVPREVQFTIAYYDLTGKLVNSTTSTHKVDETVSISPVAPANYVLVSGQAKADYLMRWGLNEVDFLVEPKVTQTSETKTVTRTIKAQTPDGQIKNFVQTVKFVRNGYLNQVTKQTTYSPWSFGGQYQFSSYQPKPIDGYTADVVPAVIVTSDSSDTTVDVVYHKISANYSVAYQLANGTVVKNVSVTPESDGLIHLTAPQGYRLLTAVTDVQVGSSSQKLAVLVAPVEQTYTAHSTLPSGVTEPLTKTVTRTVKITLPNGHVRTVKQSVKFERTVTVKADGTVAYSNWQAIGRAQFNKVFVAKRHGYHLVITDASGKSLADVTKVNNVTAEMNDALVSVKYVKD